jgi:hypothetical protein
MTMNVEFGDAYQQRYFPGIQDGSGMLDYT